ncbi:hypothetical protein C8N35_11648 [Breoghania corrubedonensis]|uniref:Portal protein n=1 Tax=Breoghania corrubedonensis TaxID=665038 RepID=A0A2T5UQ19_9HYPH|nr:hypothetical protein [Breoghania corrubedonensis]PTW53593.1 hypothetical protein C8N35_11648 [Breoghania corrubedonensis]
MFDLNADDGSVRTEKYKSPIPDKDVDTSRPRTGNKLDSLPMTMLHSQLMGYYTRELARQSSNRVEMALDEDFYDSIQWTDEDANTLKERGQIPLVFNVISTTIDWVLGSEKRSRTDFKVLPRRKEDTEPARRKSQLLKYISDVNKSRYQVSLAFEDATKVGVGWLEDGWQGDDEEEPIYSGSESWRSMLWDSAAKELDLSDARYECRSRWVDLDVARAMFPKRLSLLDRSVRETFPGWGFIDSYGDEAMDLPEEESQDGWDSDTMTNIVVAPRKRLRIIEMWFRMPVMARRLQGGVFSGELYDPHSPGHADSLQSGEAELIEKPVMRMHVALMTPIGLLFLSRSPYRHNRYPFTPIWCKRRGRDGMPYGLVRNIRDLQVDINKRASKALHILSTNKVIMDEGAVDDTDALMEEVARPDALIIKKQGKALEISNERELSAAHLQLMSRDIEMVQQVGGVTDENLGRATNAVSGVAVQARQQQGALTTSHLFDHLRFARQVQGEKRMSLIEQFMSREKQFRITDSRGRPDFIKINDGLPENDITRSKADFIIDEDDWRATQREAQLTALLDLLGRLGPVMPQLAAAMMDLIIEQMDVPNREELVKRVRQITGMRDPDEDEEQDPSFAARQQQLQQQQQLQLQMTSAQLRNIIADADKKEASAAEIRAKAVKNSVDTQASAVDAAATIAATPTTADLADMLLQAAGYPPQAAGPQQPQQSAPPPQAQRPMQAPPPPQAQVAGGLSPAGPTGR